MQFLLAALFLFSLSANAGTSTPMQFNFSGQVTDSFDNPVANKNVELKLEIFNPAMSCLLYEETQVVLTSANGKFAIAVGTLNSSGGFRGGSDPGLLMPTVYGNSAPFWCGGSPAAGDGRKLRVTIARIDGVVVNDVLATKDINSVPYAITADSANDVQGKVPADFINVNNAGALVLTQSNLENIFSSSNYTALSALIGGTSNLYSRPNANGTSQLPNIAAPATPSAGQVWYDGGVIKYHDGSITQSLRTTGALAEGDIPTLTTAGKVSGGAINSGTITGSTAINTSGAITTTGTITGALLTGSALSVDMSGSRTIRVFEPVGDGTNYTQITNPAMTANVPWVLPNAQGANGTYLMNDGLGALSWSTPAAGVTSFNTRTGAVVPAADDYTWAQINKATSSFADITTRSASDINAGTLGDGRLSSNVVMENTANLFSVGGQQINNNAAGTKPLVIRAVAAQSAPLTEWQDSAAAILYGLNPSGIPSAPTDLADKDYVDTQISGIPAGVTSFNTRAGDVVPAANDYTWAQINKATSSFADITTRNAGDINAGTLGDARLSANVVLKDVSNLFSVGGQEINNTGMGTIPLMIKAAPAQLAPLTEWRDSGNAVLYGLDATGVPIAGSDLATKDYVITQVGAYVLKTGDSMNGPLVNNSNSASTALAITQSGAGHAASFMGGNVGVGTTVPVSKLDVKGSLTGISGGLLTVVNVDTKIEPTANLTSFSQARVGHNVIAEAPITNTNATKQIIASKSYAVNNSSAGATVVAGNVGLAENYANGLSNLLIRGSYGWAYNSSTSGSDAIAGVVGESLIDGGVVGDLIGVHANPETYGGTATNQIGVLIEAHSDTSSVSNRYGVLIRAPTGGVVPSNDYGVYQASTAAQNYFGGNVGFGTTNPARPIHVNGTMRFQPSNMPGGSTIGDIYFDSGDLKLKYYDGAWKTLGEGSITNVTSISNSSSTTFNSDSDNAGSDGGFNFQSNGANLVTINNAGDVNFISSTPSTTPTSGALVVAGGAGIGGNLNVGGNGFIPQLYGSTASGGDIRIDGTTHGTKGDIYLASAGGNVGIGTVAATARLEVSEGANSYSTRMNRAGRASIDLGVPVDNTWGSRITTGAYGSDVNNWFQIIMGPDFANKQVFGADKDGTKVFFPNGNVGIGTYSPQALFEIATTAGSNPTFYMSDGDVSHGMTSVTADNNFFKVAPLNTNFGGAKLTGFSDVATVPGMALIGVIGDAVPGAEIPAITLSSYKKNGTTTQGLGNSETALQVQNGSVPLMTVMGGGNVGIGTTNPGSKLTVAGTIESIGGGVKFPDGTTQTTSAVTILVAGPNGSVGGGGTQYAGFGMTGFNAIESTRQIPMPMAGSIATLSLFSNTMQPATGNTTCTLMKNGVGTGLAVTIPASGIGIYSFTMGAPVAIAANDLLSIRCDNLAAAASANIVSFTTIYKF